MESLKHALESIGRLWANLTATQRVILSAAAVLMVLLLVWGSSSSTEAWVRVAGPEVNATNRASILKRLQERGQKHQVRGSEILVPKEDGDRVVLDLAGEGAMTNDAMWDFLKDSDPFMGPRQKDLRYKRALEQKLGSMIRGAKFVLNASVLITPGSESDRVGFEGSRAKASVQVELEEGRSLSPKNVMAIANLVARAVPGLDADQVVITDNKLNSYALPRQDAGSMQALWFRDYEKQIEDDIQSRIKLAFRTASVVVRITAKNLSSTRELEKHTNPKPLREVDRKSVEKGNVAPPGKGFKGEDSVAPPVENGGRTEQETATDYTHDREKLKEENPAGKIERISIGVLIPVEVGPDGKELEEAEKQKPIITDWVLKAADAPEKSVSVEFIPSKRPEPIAAAAGTDGALLWLSAHTAKIAIAVLALAGFLALWRVIRGAGARDSVEELQALTTALTETREAAVELGLPGEGDTARLKQGLQDMVGRNPQAVAASLKSFMSGR